MTAGTVEELKRFLVPEGVTQQGIRTVEPKLPDWAVFDLAVPRGERRARGIKAAGFFGEKWE